MLEGLNSVLENIGISLKESVDKVKDAATSAGKEYLASNPYGQAASQGGSSIFGKRGSDSRASLAPSVSPSTSVAPARTSTGTGLKKGTLRQILTGKKTLMGIPILFIGAGVGGFFLLKKLKRR